MHQNHHCFLPSCLFLLSCFFSISSWLVLRHFLLKKSCHSIHQIHLNHQKSLLPFWVSFQNQNMICCYLYLAWVSSCLLHHYSHRCRCHRLMWGIFYSSSYISIFPCCCHYYLHC